MRFGFRLPPPAVQQRLAEINDCTTFDSRLVQPELQYLHSFEDDIMGPQKPTPTLDLSEVKSSIQFNLNEKTVCFIGAGAAAITMGSYLIAKGVDPAQITIIDTAAAYGGQWQKTTVKMGGFNNPVGLYFDRDHTLSIEDRSGERMERFIGNVATSYLKGVNRVQSNVSGLQRQQDSTWMVTTDNERYNADYVVMATGTPHPRRIDSRLQSNLENSGLSQIDAEELMIVRHQREITPEEYDSGRPIIFLGFGNSTAAMVNQIYAYEDATGKRVNYLVASDLSNEALKRPNEAANGRNKPFFRQPARGYLTGYSGDLDRDRKNFYRVLSSDRCITNVRSINYSQAKGGLEINTANGQMLFFSQPILFSLIGQERDTSLLEKVGAIDKSHNQPVIRAADGAIWLPETKFASNLFAAGSFAATTMNPNVATIPGIMGHTRSTFVTLAIRSCSKSSWLSSMVNSMTFRRAGL